MDWKDYITDVPDFPKPGILFRDISPLLREQFIPALNAMSALVPAEMWKMVDIIGGIESRGFILGAGLATMQGKGFVKIRKQGKLPGKAHQVSYALEYGEAALEMQPGSGGRMLIVDDVLATGGTLSAAAELADTAGYEVAGFMLLINLKSLNHFSWNHRPTYTLIEYP